ncbi:cytoplasmic chaperone TorD family protein [Ferrimonas balearica DSM 9799]|uniref:Cytoplasmic chaperone TorD family protein n=1 Tax=Ferrimonas balearica (strain DSM 9799 / CCM 4581 / KCTC 23876 / PAT) TaxID=550540 RepID=E1SMW4_FERBD|nr:molecular chaperone TorD family protein [Ferrimonas balearica]ADN76633.1 cytoplasmic chaperone TorD family protein [Ferrimonas balearica DSM 9799]MBY5982292.1 molecular chaperone TorD family protein [Ferrimonas balearica]
MLNQDQLSQYQAQCNVLYHAIYFEPSDVMPDRLRAVDVVHSWPQTGAADARAAGLALLGEALAEDNDTLLPRLKRDFTELFIGPVELKVIPWGSPYLHEKRLLCGPSTQALVQFYQHYGILVTTQLNEPVDHIGLMLSVLSSLLEQEVDKQDGAALEVLRVLLAEHLLPWSPRFCDKLANAAQTPYYRGLALLITSVLEGLKQDLGVQPLSLQLFQ